MKAFLAEFAALTAKAMRRAAEEFGIKGNLVVTHMSNEGAHVTKVDPPFSSGGITYKDNI